MASSCFYFILLLCFLQFSFILKLLMSINEAKTTISICNNEIAGLTKESLKLEKSPIISIPKTVSDPIEGVAITVRINTSRL